MTDNQKRRQKLVITGSGYTGKTTLLLSALHDKYYPPENYEYCVSPGEITCTYLDKNGQKRHVQMSLWDKASDYDNHRLEPLRYPRSTVAVIVYAINSIDSFDSVEEQWLPEVRHFLKDVPIVLVGLKKDLRDGASNESNTHEVSFVSTKMGEKLAKQIGAAHFTECSSLTGDGVKELFDSAAGLAVAYSKQEVKKQRCRFL